MPREATQRPPHEWPSDRIFAAYRLIDITESDEAEVRTSAEPPLWTNAAPAGFSWAPVQNGMF